MRFVAAAWPTPPISSMELYLPRNKMADGRIIVTLCYFYCITKCMNEVDIVIIERREECSGAGEKEDS